MRVVLFLSIIHASIGAMDTRLKSLVLYAENRQLSFKPKLINGRYLEVVSSWAASMYRRVDDTTEEIGMTHYKELYEQYPPPKDCQTYGKIIYLEPFKCMPRSSDCYTRRQQLISFVCYHFTHLKCTAVLVTLLQQDDAKIACYTKSGFSRVKAYELCLSCIKKKVEKQNDLRDSDLIAQGTSDLEVSSQLSEPIEHEDNHTEVFALVDYVKQLP